MSNGTQECGVGAWRCGGGAVSGGGRFLWAVVFLVGGLAVGCGGGGGGGASAAFGSLQVSFAQVLVAGASLPPDSPGVYTVTTGVAVTFEAKALDASRDVTASDTTSWAWSVNGVDDPAGWVSGSASGWQHTFTAASFGVGSYLLTVSSSESGGPSAQASLTIHVTDTPAILSIDTGGGTINVTGNWIQGDYATLQLPNWAGATTTIVVAGQSTVTVSGQATIITGSVGSGGLTIIADGSSGTKLLQLKNLSGPSGSVVDVSVKNGANPFATVEISPSVTLGQLWVTAKSSVIVDAPSATTATLTLGTQTSPGAFKIFAKGSTSFPTKVYVGGGTIPTFP